jgi:hypothetical protein
MYGSIIRVRVNGQVRCAESITLVSHMRAWNKVSGHRDVLFSTFRSLDQVGLVPIPEQNGMFRIVSIVSANAGLPGVTPRSLRKGFQALLDKKIPKETRRCA